MIRFTLRVLHQLKKCSENVVFLWFRGVFGAFFCKNFEEFVSKFVSGLVQILFNYVLLLEVAENAYVMLTCCFNI